MNPLDALPVSFIERSGRASIEVARCQADGGLVILSSQDHLSRHAGHTLKQPVILTESEVKALQELP